MLIEQQVAPGFSTTPCGHLALDMCMFFTLQKYISLLIEKISFSLLFIYKTVKAFQHSSFHICTIHIVHVLNISHVYII